MDAVVVTHNSAEDLRVLIASEPTRRAFDRIIVVDNASSDETREVASQARLELIALSENQGLSAAANRGVSESTGASFALLNPDVRVSSTDDLSRLERHLADPSVGAVAPALELPSGELQDSARWVPTPFDLVVRRFTGEPLGAIRETRPVDVDWAVAAFLLIRRSAFDLIGGFDEGYFLYFEDVDFGVRLRAAGFRIRYDPSIRFHHDHRAASRSGFHSPPTRAHMRSALRFYRRNPGAILPRRRRTPASAGR